jgi:hypothetical protein
MLDVANINFRCCGCEFSMLQTCDVECCVKWEERGLPLMLDVVNIEFLMWQMLSFDGADI